jgi:hypothetical protein
MHRIAPALLTGFSALALSCAACGPSNYFVKNLKIDAAQHLIPVGAKSLDHPNDGSYYMFFHTATQLTTVNHLAWQTRRDDVRQLLYLETNQNKLLDRTVKADEILTGPFGAVIAEKTCFYNRAVETSPPSIKVLIQSDNPDIGREIPDEVPEAPKDPSSLTSIAVVRFFNADPEVIFAAGNYEASGVLGSIHQGRGRKGDLQGGSSITFPLAPDFRELQEQYGLSPRIDVNSYLQSKRIPLAKTAFTEERSIAILVYGFGKFIRQDSLVNGSVVSSRYLRPVVTEEERILGPECDQRLRQQQAAGGPTVQ